MSAKRRFVTILILAILLNVIITRATIPSGSMKPTFLINDYVFYLNTDKVSVGDIILFKIDHDPSFYTKRVVAIGPAIVEIKENQVIINHVISENQWDTIHQGMTGIFEIPEGAYFLMGDNRSNSRDSRSFGYVLKENIKGRYLFHFPFGKIFE